MGAASIFDAELDAEDVIDWESLSPPDETCSLGLFLWFAVVVGGAFWGGLVSWFGLRRTRA